MMTLDELKKRLQASGVNLGDCSEEELREMFRSSGINLNEWQSHPEKSFEPSFAKNAKEMLLSMKSILEAQVQKDVGDVKKLREARFRLKHGGGVSG